MKKRLLCLALALAAVVSCYGCGQEKPEVVETEAESRPVLEIYAGQSEKENLEFLAEAYEEQNGEAGINIHLIPDSEYTQQMMRIKNHEVPADCIFFRDANEAAVWRHKKVFKDVSPWYADSDEAAYYETWYGDMQEEEAYYMIPYRIGKICVYYNKTLFDRLGVDYPEEEWTWEDYKETAKQLTGWSDHKKIYGSMGFGGDGIWWMLPARTAGASDPYDRENLEIFRSSAEWCHEFNSEFAANFPYFEWADEEWNGYNMLFLEGRLGMYFGEDSEVNLLNEEIRKQGLQLEYDVAQLPVWDNRERAQVYQTAVVCMAEASQYPEEAYRFMEFCAGRQGGLILAENGTVPAWQTDEVRQTYLASTQIPAHKEYFLGDGVPEGSSAADVLYYAGLEAMKNEVSLYMLNEQELDYTFAKIEEEMKSLRAEQS